MRIIWAISTILLAVSCFLCSNEEANATGGAFNYTKHGGGDPDGVGAPGVNRAVNSDYSGLGHYMDSLQAGKYKPGDCNHCHELHSSFGGNQPDPVDDSAPNPYQLFKEYGEATGDYSAVCWYCHESMTLGGNLIGHGYWNFYLGQTKYEASSHHNSSNFTWPGILGDPVSIWPRKSRQSQSLGNRGSCLNCHTPHGIKEGGDSTAFDVAAVPTSPTNLHLQANNASVSTDYLIPRQLIAWEEALCENCHDINGPAIDIQTDIDKRHISGSGHPVDDTSLAGRHVASEVTPIAVKHVECYDCHNPHVATGEGSNGTVGSTNFNRLAGMSFVRTDGVATNPDMEGRDPFVHEVCFRCHSDNYATFIPERLDGSSQPIRTSTGRPASSHTHGSNKRLEFNPASIGSQIPSNENPSQANNTAFHPIDSQGRNQSAALQRQLIGGLSTTSTITCTDCHNSDVTGATPGPVTESNVSRVSDVASNYVGAGALGPHGSQPFPVGGYQTHRILRANFNTTLDNGVGGKPFTSFDRNNFALCFLCHDEDAFTCQPATEDCGWIEGPKTNFYSVTFDINLHAAHVAGKPGISPNGTTSTCANCHYNIHSNVEAANTKYETPDSYWRRTTDGGSRLINFSPAVGPSTLYSYGKPVWGCSDWFGWKKGCNFDCHQFDQELYYASPDIATSCNY